MSGVAMSTAAPKGRKHLCADSLFNLLHGSFANIADDGVDEVEIPLSDALMSAFAMFSLICGVQEYVESMAKRPGNSIQQG